MRKSAALLLVLVFLTASSIITLSPAKAQSLETIFIKADGSVEGTDKIQRDENDVYTLTGNISGRILVQRSNIIIDGAGYTLEGNGDGKGIDLSNGRTTDKSRDMITNVTVKNTRIIQFEYGIACWHTQNHTFIGNYVANSDIAHAVGFSIRSVGNNTLRYNTILSEVNIIYSARVNVITENNFIEGGLFVGVECPEPVVDRNYWSDYLTKYPNATEIGNTGVWDTPYCWDMEYHDSLGYTDNHPLVEPVSAPVDFTGPSILFLSIENKTYDEGSIPLNFTVNEAVTQITYSLDGKENITITGNTTLTGLPNGDHNLTIYAEDESGNVGASETMYFSVDVPFPTALVVAASIIAIVVVSAVLLVYFRKRNSGRNQ